MKTVVFFCLCVAAATALPSVDFREKGVVAEYCDDAVCRAIDGCRCSSSKSPLQSTELTPQLISITFDEAVTEELYSLYFQPLLSGRVNPDGRKIGATFFVPHEYTYYTAVNRLYNDGFEIGVHSITNNDLQKYWRDASVALLDQEFGGQRTIISKYANIPAQEIIGARTPQLQIAGNVTFESYLDSGILYDSSWPTLSAEPLFPYSLDYLSTQECILGTRCPNEAFKGIWVLPINDLNGKYAECNNLASCEVDGTASEIARWLLEEVNKVRTTTRVPLTFLISTSWFEATENSLQGFNQFLTSVSQYNDVYFVSQKQVLDWSKNPVPLSEFRTAISERNAPCEYHGCAGLRVDINQLRYMSSCVPCPRNYPWLGNPDGN